jgi:hypothetical protein
LKCPFFKQAQCGFRAQETRKEVVGVVGGQEFSLRIGHVPHSDHSKAVATNSQVTLHVRTQFKELRQFSTMGPQKAIGWLTGPHQEGGLNIHLSQLQQESVSRWFTRRKTMVHNPDGDNSSQRWSTAYTAAMRHLRDRTNIETESLFSMHEVYLIDGGGTVSQPILFDEDALVLDGEPCVRFGALLSSENLILNQYRQTFLGRGLTYELDTSYRYSHEKIQFMPLRCRAGNHRSKALGWAIVTTDDTPSFEHIIRLAKIECEQIIKKKMQNGRRARRLLAVLAVMIIGSTLQLFRGLLAFIVIQQCFEYRTTSSTVLYD